MRPAERVRADAVARAAVLALAIILPATGDVAAQSPTLPRDDSYKVAAQLQSPSEVRVDITIVPDHLDEIVPPPRIAAVRGSIGQVELDGVEALAYPADTQTTAVLFLLDISDPARQQVVDKNLEQIAAMARAGGSHHRFGLATFAETLDLVVELGADAATIASAAKGIRAVGQRTELIRLGAEAVALMDRVHADRKAIVLLSDGMAEDDPAAYPPSHFADAARQAEVRVYALGFHRSRAETFGKMRFIAEHSGGAFVRAAPSYELPEPFLEAPFAWIDAGASAILDAEPALEAGLGGSQTLDLTLELADGTEVHAGAAVQLPSPSDTGTPPSLRERIITHWPLVATGAIVVLVLASLLIWGIARRKQRSRKRRPIAQLDFLDGQGSRWSMEKKSAKIGRNADNDLQLKNDTVSAYHATIHLQRDGTFIITDLNSLNGVTVNGKTVEIAELNDGDEIELGEVRCRFMVSGAGPEGLLTGPEAGRTLPDEDGR